MTVESITEWDTCIVRIPAFSRSSAEHQHFSVSSYEDARRRAPGLRTCFTTRGGSAGR